MAGACTCTCTCLLVAATGEMTHRGSSSVFRTPDLGPPADRERGPVTTVGRHLPGSRNELPRDLDVRRLARR